MAVGLTLPGLAPAQDAANPPAAEKIYIVQLREPAAIQAMGAPGAQNRVTPRGRFDARAGAVRSYAAQLTAEHDRLLAGIGALDGKVYSYRLTFNGFAARLTQAQAAKLAADPAVARLMPDRIRHLQSNASASFLGLLDMTGGLRRDLALKGEDVVIGIIDSGITPDHASFADRIEQKKPRACRSEWAESSLLGRWLCARFRKPRYTAAYARPVDWHGRCETGERFTAAHCNNKLIGARYYYAGFQDAGYDMDPQEFLSARDADGHGTHIASVAAGNAAKAALGGTVVADISGIAPRARIAVYKACWLEAGATRGTCAMSDLKSAIEDAVADGVDIISYAVGTTEGGPLDFDAQALLNASDAGVLAVVAAGNGGPAAETIESPGSAPWVLTVAASSRAGRRFDEVLRVTTPATAVGDFTSKEGGFTPALRSAGPITGRLVLADDGEPVTSDACQSLANASVVNGRIALISRGSCTFQEKLANAQAAGARAAVVYTDLGGPIIMTSERGSVNIPAVMISRTDGDFLVARLAAGDAVEVRLEKGLIAARTATGNIVYGASARGPNPISRDILKPDVTAPGADILGAQTPDVANGVRGERYQYLSGTSMAVPQVAGIAALLREAHPEWSPAAIRSALVTTARQDVVKENGTTAADPFDVGGGHVVPNHAANPGLVYEAGRDDYDAWACGAGIPRVSDEACAALAEEFPTAIDELNLPSLAQGALVGERTVRRRVTNVGPAASYQALVSPPAGVGMSVSPATLSLGSGETGEFAVTFTNLGLAVALDGWEFGSLTWVSGSQQVRSPVAVRTAALGAPALVTGTGITGQTGFEVQFGYDGSYGVAADGLAAPLTFTGLVLDDPLGVYTIIADDGALPDHIRRFHITVPAGTSYLRVALSGSDAGSADDLDLYLLCPDNLCPDGTEGLASAGAAAEEAIDILHPDAGEYVVDVHGFETDETVGGPGANFALRAWTVGGQAGEGNLQVSAPGAASVGGSGEVLVSWQDLAPGEVYLGLITHDNGERELGQTLVEVDSK